MESTPPFALPPRMDTGVPGLNIVLRGGLFPGGMYLITGPSGTGKTILGNQMCFQQVASGGAAVYVTLLAESHARMLTHIGSLSFFRADQVAQRITYVSGFGELETGGLQGLLKSLRTIVLERKATILVLDGVTTASRLAQSPLDFRKFLRELQVLIEVVGCTALLIANEENRPEIPIENTIVDGIISLSDERHGLRAVRELDVVKLRGSDYLRGRHFYDINRDGIRVYPRVETLLAHRAAPSVDPDDRLGTGVPGLDELMGGGLPANSSTLVYGRSGAGKTTFGMQYLVEGLRRGETVLCAGIESSTTMALTGRRLYPEFDAAVADGRATLLWWEPVEYYLEGLAEELFHHVRRSRPRRIFIDGLGTLMAGAVYQDRLPTFLASIYDELMRCGATLVTSLQELDGGNFPKATALPPVAHNLILLTEEEAGHELRRQLWVRHMRNSGCDTQGRRYLIEDSGLRVDAAQRGLRGES